MLAALRAEAAFMPIDATYPVSRIETMLEIARPQAIVAARETLPLLPARRPPVLFADDGEPAELPATAADRPPALACRDAACVLFTSGSTGRPKAAVLTHAGLVNYCCFEQETYALQPTDVVLQFHTLSFDGSLEEIFPSVLTGACIAVCGDEAAGEVDSLFGFASSRGVTVAHLPPALLNAWLSEADPAPLPSSVRLVVTGGEAQSPSAVARFRRRAPGVQLMNIYGQTETTIMATVEDTTDWAGEAPPPVGRPIPNVNVYLLDESGAPVPRGQIGEIAVGGRGVGLGYLDDAERTAEVFVADPLSPQDLCYRSGDLGRLRDEGALEFLGRRDRQVKVRGFRVELEEVEANLLAHPAVADCACLAEDDRLAAFVVVRGPADGVEADIRRFLAQRLPAFMVPGRILVRDRLPLTAVGKVDYRLLASEVETSRELRSRNPPVGELEAAIARIWSSLGLGEVGRDDDFYERGGHSLLAMRLLSRISSELGAGVRLREFLDEPTVRALARRIEERGALEGGAAAATAPESPELRAEDLAGLSPAEARAKLEEVFGV
jgi:amino acid adenylation domain-containing protein